MTTRDWAFHFKNIIVSAVGYHALHCQTIFLVQGTHTYHLGLAALKIWPTLIIGRNFSVFGWLCIFVEDCFVFL